MTTHLFSNRRRVPAAGPRRRRRRRCRARRGGTLRPLAGNGTGQRAPPGEAEARRVVGLAAAVAGASDGERRLTPTVIPAKRPQGARAGIYGWARRQAAPWAPDRRSLTLACPG